MALDYEDDGTVHPGDIAVIVAYFTFVLVVGLWVSMY
jgi:hypothetical protein